MSAAPPAAPGGTSGQDGRGWGHRVLRVHDFMPSSWANGPGQRAVLWVQGCSRRCPGCCNPATHPLEGGRTLEVGEIWSRIEGLTATLEGLTVSGGEPLEQLPGLLALLECVRSSSRLSVILFTGWTFGQVTSLPDSQALLSCLDLLVAGPYESARRRPGGLRGSANQTLHFLTERYTLGDVQEVPEAEILITPTGEVLCTGVDGSGALAGLTVRTGEGPPP